MIKKCLLISPLSFYSWHSAVQKELEARGYKVQVLNDEYPNSTLGLLIGNFANWLVRKLTYNKIVNHLGNNDGYDVVLIFKGRGISTELIRELKLKARVVYAYNFDSFGYFPFALDWYRETTKYKTFDYDDSVKYGLEQVDLYSDRELKEHTPKLYDISCVMKNHSDRLKYLDQIFDHLGEQYSFKILIYEKNLFTFIRSAFKNPILCFKWRKHLSFTGLTEDEFFKVLASSKYTLDYAHPTQSGLTMRTFQALACGTKLISNNNSLKKCDLIKKTDFYVHSLNDGAEGLKVHLQKQLNERTSIVFRGIGDFIDDLLE